MHRSVVDMNAASAGGDGGLPHERLDVFRVAEELARLAFVLARRVPPGQQDLRSQTERAATSVTGNTAEGALELSRRRKAQYYRIARASAGELHTHVRSLRALSLVTPDELQTVTALVDRVSAMLYRLIQRFGG